MPLHPPTGEGQLLYLNTLLPPSGAREVPQWRTGSTAHLHHALLPAREQAVPEAAIEWGGGNGWDDARDVLVPPHDDNNLPDTMPVSGAAQNTKHSTILASIARCSTRQSCLMRPCPCIHAVLCALRDALC
jgi:hypothetical protein